MATHARLGQAAQFRVLTEALPARLPSSGGRGGARAGAHVQEAKGGPIILSACQDHHQGVKLPGMMVSLCPSGGCCRNRLDGWSPLPGSPPGDLRARDLLPGLGPARQAATAGEQNPSLPPTFKAASSLLLLPNSKR